MLMPPISRYMTNSAVTVGPDEPWSARNELMRAHQFRHLPVVDRGKLVGVVTDHDLGRLMVSRRRTVSRKEVEALRHAPIAGEFAYLYLDATFGRPTVAAP